jgi:hypothetical protein
MFGPIIVDVTAPKFTGSHIDVELKDKTIVANWSKESFTDEEDPYPLAYEFALGNCIYTVKPVHVVTCI